MIFRLDLSRSQLQALPIQIVNNAISELLRAHRLGFHLFVLPRDIALFLAQNLDLNDKEKSLLKRLSTEFTQTNGLTAGAAVYASICDVKEIKRSGAAITLPLSTVSQSLVGTPCGLLVENSLYDGTIYKAILDSLRTFMKTPHLNMMILNGGGESIDVEFQRHVRSRSMLLCPIDSDRVTPFESLPTKLAEMNGFATKEGWPFGRAIVLPCHELENAIPRTILHEIPSAVDCKWNDLGNKISAKEVAQNVESCERFWLFLDLKEGLSSDSLNRITDKGLVWLTKRLSIVGIAVKSSGEEWEIKGYGQNVIRQLINSNLLLSRLHREVRENDWLKHFRPFFEEMIWHFVAARPINT